MRAIAAVLTLCAACSGSRPAAPPPAARDSTPGTAHEAGHILLEQHCGACHRGDEPDAPAAALAIFDLTTDGWYRMTPAQLRSAASRIRDQAGADGAAQFERFIAAELVRRIVAAAAP